MVVAGTSDRIFRLFPDESFNWMWGRSYLDDEKIGPREFLRVLYVTGRIVLDTARARAHAPGPMKRFVKAADFLRPKDG